MPTTHYCLGQRKEGPRRGMGEVGIRVGRELEINQKKNKLNLEVGGKKYVSDLAI